MKTYTPLKYTGSKSYLAELINDKIQNSNKNTYVEPFCGGCSVGLYNLQHQRNFNTYIFSDINNDVISTFNYLKNEHINDIISAYTKHHSKFNSKDIQYRKDYFIEQRNIFNQTKDPSIFYFLTRTSVNGLIRYNKKGEFNVSSHFSRAGMKPNKVRKLIDTFKSSINGKRVLFQNKTYQEQIHDACYFFDPPYELLSKDNYNSMYIQHPDFGDFKEFIDRLDEFVLTYGNDIKNDFNFNLDRLESKSTKGFFRKHESVRENIYYKGL